MANMLAGLLFMFIAFFSIILAFSHLVNIKKQSYIP